MPKMEAPDVPPVPMHNFYRACAEPLAAFIDGREVRVPALPPLLDGQEFDTLRQRYKRFDAPSDRFEPEWERAPFLVRPPVDPGDGRR